MQTYSVVFVAADLEHPEVYVCEADDAVHAWEQADDANPGCYINFVFMSDGPELVGRSRTHQPVPPSGQSAPCCTVCGGGKADDDDEIVMLDSTEWVHKYPCDEQPVPPTRVEWQNETPLATA